MKETKKFVVPQAFTLAGRLKSFRYALAGVGFMLKTQHNAWLHGLATLLVIGLALYCNVSASDWRWLTVAMGMVWVAETLNTAVEYMCDMVSPGYSEAVKHAKDISAGGVLIAALAALLVGVLTLWPYFS
ncbi:MAG: diacylglycerol kinase family protein [Pseudomonadota bacterium]